MNIEIDYYEEDGALAENTKKVLTVDEFLHSLENYCLKELETNSFTKNRYEMQSREKNSEGFYGFTLTGTQAEMEELAQKMNMNLPWAPEFVLVAHAKTKVLRNSDNQLMFITHVSGSHAPTRVTLCSPQGDVLELPVSELYANYRLA